MVSSNHRMTQGHTLSLIAHLVSFSRDVHLSVEDIAVDSYKLPTSLHICLMASKTYPFCKGCLIHNRRGNSPLGTVQLLMAYLTSVLGLSYLLAM